MPKSEIQNTKCETYHKLEIGNSNLSVISRFGFRIWLPHAALGLIALSASLSVFFILAHDAYGQAMSSSNYKIQSQSINFGGVRSASGNYTIEDTAGEIATGISSSTNYVMGAGYQQMNVVYLSVTQASNVTMSPSLGGLTGGTSNGSTSFIVTTDDPAGYTATIQASSSPALHDATDSFADYIPAGAAPDFSFTYAAASSTFGFSPKGADITARYQDNTSACGTGSSQTAGACWDGLSTSPKPFLSRTSNNTPSGSTITLNFRAGIGTSRDQTNGTYIATTTVTVIAL